MRCVILSFVLLLLSGAALADGAYIVFQLRTNAAPEVDFDEIRVAVWREADGAVAGSATHRADATRDYGAGVRVAEIELPAGFDDGRYRATMGMYSSGSLIFERPIRFESCCHAHGVFFHRPPVRIITVVLVPEILIDEVDKTVASLIDADGSGGFSPGDTVRYTVEVPASHDIAGGSVFRDELDPGVILVAGSVTTSSGVVIRGNNPSDRSVEVRFDPVPIGDNILIEYDAVLRPVIDNQGDLGIGIAGTRIGYPRVTDDPTTQEPDDPTRIVLSCGPQDEPPAPPFVDTEVFPTSIPQFAESGIRISGQGFGTQAGAPTLLVNGTALKTEVLLYSSEFETVEAVLPADITAEAGVVPFTLIPVDPQLPPIKGNLEIATAPVTGAEVVEGVRETVSAQVSAFVGNGLTAFQDARDLAARSQSRCKEIRDDILSDLDRTLTSGSIAIGISGAVAAQQAQAINATPGELDDIQRTVDDGTGLLAALLRQLEKEARRGNGLLCSPKKKLKN